MTFHFSVSSIEGSDGDIVEIPPSGLVVFVGPNNVGKSRALIDIVNGLTNSDKTIVLTHIGARRSGDNDVVIEWLKTNTRADLRADGTYYGHLGNSIKAEYIPGHWNTTDNVFGPLASLFIKYLNTDARLSLVSSVGSFDTYNTAPNSPLQLLYSDAILEARFSELMKEAFGLGVTVNRFGGTTIHLHLGQVDVLPTYPPSKEYMEAVNRLPLVSAQGDGVRCYAGVVLAAISGEWPVLVVDEPEAFLHPPQARRLGRQLAEAANVGQVVVATHSLDFLLGSLDAGISDITVIRLTRSGNLNSLHVLDSSSIKKTWSDPLLRYSKILDAVFFKGVVLCESDADCRFYQALLDSSRAQHGLPVDDILFTHCGGKARMASVASAIRAFNIPIAVVADLDILNDWTVVAGLISTLGGEEAQFESDVKTVNAHAASTGFSPYKTQVRSDIDEALTLDGGERLSRAESERIAEVSHVQTGWKQLKLGGVAALPNGNPSEAASRIIGRGRQIGLFPVPVGELERWLTSVPGHGPRWTTEALASGKHAGPEAAPARSFIIEVAEFLLAQ